MDADDAFGSSTMIIEIAWAIKNPFSQSCSRDSSHRRLEFFCAAQEPVRRRVGDGRDGITFPRLFSLISWAMILKINFRPNNANKTVKGFTNGSSASFAASRALTDFHHISITSSSKWNLIRFFTTITGPLEHNMMHGIYDNLFVENVAKNEATFAYATKITRRGTGKAIATLVRLRWDEARISGFSSYSGQRALEGWKTNFMRDFLCLRKS